MNFPHWHYWSGLVDDVEHISRYVELSADNFGTYSTELTQLFLAACSEIDVVAKRLCEKTDPATRPGNICEYAKVLLAKYPNLPSTEITIPRAKLEFVPWCDWSEKSSPAWWKSYNNVKHERDKYYPEGNLGNVLNSIAGLCVLVCYLYYDDGRIEGGWPDQKLRFYLSKKYAVKKTALLRAGDGIQLPDFVRKPKDEGKK